METDKDESYRSPVVKWVKRGILIVLISAVVSMVAAYSWQNSRASYKTISECKDSNLHSIKSSPCVKALQDALNVKHRACEPDLAVLRVSGNFDDETKKAVSDYRSKNNIEASGEIDSKTMQDLIDRDKECLASTVGTLKADKILALNTNSNNNESTVEVKGWKKLGSSEIDIESSKLGFSIYMCRTSDYQVKVRSAIDSTSVPSSYLFSVAAVDQDDNYIVEVAPVAASTKANIEGSLSQAKVDKNVTLRGLGSITDSGVEAGSYTTGILASELYVCE